MRAVSFLALLFVAVRSHAAEVADQLLPSSAISVGHYDHASAPLLSLVERNASTPPCFAALRKQSGGYTQINVADINTSVMEFETTASRAEVESCTAKVVEAMFGGVAAPTRTGETTRFAGKAAFTLGFHPGFVVESNDAGLVDTALRALAGHDHGPSPALRALLGRAQRTAPLWGVATLDFGRLLGVPSQGFLLAVDGSKQEGQILFGSVADAKRGALAFEHPPFASQHPAVARALHGVARQADATVVVDLGTLMKNLDTDASTMKEATEMLEAAKQPAAR